MDPTTTNQVEHVPNPTGKGGFGDNPQNRNDGRWKSEDSISFQYNKMIRYTIEELEKWLDENPEETRTVAQDIAYNAVLEARKDLSYLKEITDRTEGKAPQTIRHQGGFFLTDKLVWDDVNEHSEDNQGETEPQTETSPATTE